MLHAEATGVSYLESYETDALNTAAPWPADLAMAATQIPANMGCTPLTLRATPGTGVAATTVTATTDLSLLPAAEINVFEQVPGVTGLEDQVGYCNAMTSCAVQVRQGAVRTTFTADVGAPGTIPYSSQAIVSARLIVGTSDSKPIIVVPPPCKGSTCT